MRTLLIGIDSGTQSTKVLVVNAVSGKVVGSAAKTYDLIPNLPPGAKEQHHFHQGRGFQIVCGPVAQIRGRREPNARRPEETDRYL